MDNDATLEIRHMAKVQKTFYLNAELNQLVDVLADVTGASFTKIVTAALVRYLIQDFPDTGFRAMRMASAIEKGTHSVPSAFLAELQDRVNSLQSDIDSYTKNDRPRDEIHRLEVNLLRAKALYDEVKKAMDSADEKIEWLALTLADTRHALDRPQSD